MPRPRPTPEPGQADACPGCCGYWGNACRVRVHQPLVETPSSFSILATEPVSSSKNSSLTFSQPPNSSIVNRSLGVGNCFSVDQFRVDRAVAVLSPQFLAGVRPDVVEELLRRLRGVFGDGDRGLDQDRAGRDHVVDVLALVLGLDRLVLVAEQHVALALGEGGERVAGAARLHHRLVEHGLDGVERLLRGFARVQLRAVDRHDVPARGAGAERVRGDDLDVLGQQVVKRLQALGVALADRHDDDRVLGDPVVLLLVPIGRDLAGFDQADHVAALGEMDDGGGLTGLDRTALVAGGAE